MNNVLDLFIDKLTTIDESKWGCTDQGFKQDIIDLTREPRDEGRALWDLIQERTKGHMTLLYVNDGLDTRYKQLTPKQRVMAFLRDIKNDTLHN